MVSCFCYNKDTPTEAELKKQVEQWVEEEDDTPRKVAPNRPNIYGAIDSKLKIALLHWSR